MSFGDYILGHNERLLRRPYILDIFTFNKDRPVHPEPPKIEGGIVFKTKHADPEKCTYAYTNDAGELVDIPPVEGGTAPFTIREVMTVTPKHLANVDKSMETTVGRYITNHNLLASVFDSRVPYVNTIFSIKEVERLLAGKILDGTVSTPEYKKYIRQGYSLGHLGELFVTTHSPKSITISKEIINRRNELLEKHKDELDNPLVVAHLEGELVEMYREYLDGDDAQIYLDGLGVGSTYADKLKKLYLMYGGIDDFGTGKTVTIARSLAEGWDPTEISALSNVTRDTSYARGKKTQDGGTLTKLIFRIFGGVSITIDDCKAKDGLSVQFSNIIKPSMFMGRYVMRGESLTMITEANASTFENKKVKLRSLMYCKAKDTYCYTCAGNHFKKLEVSKPGTLAIVVSASFMNAAMAKMHAGKIVAKKLNYEEFFV